MATDDQLDVDTIMSEFTIEPEDSATDTVQVSTADHNSNNNSSSSNNNAAAVAEAAPEITEPAAADCIAEGAAAGSADTPPAEPQSPTVTVAAATPMGGNAAGEDQLFTLDPALTVPDGDPEGEGADTDLPPRPPANRRNDTPREGAPVTPAGASCCGLCVNTLSPHAQLAHNSRTPSTRASSVPHAGVHCCERLCFGL